MPSSKGFLIREDRWAYLQYGEDASRGQKLFEMQTDPNQFTNLVDASEYASEVARLQAKLTQKLATVRGNDLSVIVSPR